jgi:metal-responsive CopG/Arc/MetJ family transcriptional regulator
MGVISISIPDDLQEVFDKFSEQQKFSSRSDAFRAAIQALINQTEDIRKIQGEHAFLSAYILRDKPETWERFENQMDVFRNNVKNVHSYKYGNQRICTLFSIGHARDIEKMHGVLTAIKDVSGTLLKVLV